MSVTTEESAGAAAIRPFTVEIPEADIEALRERYGSRDESRVDRGTLQAPAA